MYEVPNGQLVDIDFSTCKYKSQPQAPEIQIYAMDVEHSPTTGFVTQMNATWVVPELPPSRDRQIVYFWPGFKSTSPTMGLPVLQPVLQYGQSGAPNGWELQSWFVWGQEDISVTAPAIPVSPGDKLVSWMNYDSTGRVWTVYGQNTRTGRDSDLRISRANAGNCDYKWAMLVLETIMNTGVCDDYPASSSLTFSGVSLMGTFPQWTSKVTGHDCRQAITQVSNDTVRLSWSNNPTII
jgi:hypothetical protein